MHDDRENSEQPESEISKVCNPKDDEAGFLPCSGVDDRFCKRAPQCNCSVAPGVAATALPPTSAMARYVGRSKTYIGETHELAGDFLSFPKAGACAEGEALGDGGCVWKRLPRARVLYGADLLAAGYNTSQAGFNGVSPAVEIAFGLRQMDAFARAADALDELVQPRCCGC